ncbi:MAG: DUF3857 domain-containing protein [Verrucomicrobiae bacterium]|nr:DUF3857 domain-containing protein [Verrucomicrobiae bacterium]
MVPCRLFAALFTAACFFALHPPLHSQIPAPGSEGKIPLTWASSLEESLKLAEKEKKPVIADFTTDWCGWSKKMDRETFAAEPVQKLLKDCILVRVNPEASDQNRKFAEQYKVNGYPTIIILNYRGESMADSNGFMDEDQFVKFLAPHLRGFKKNPLGYDAATLPAGDPLLPLLSKAPPASALPSHLGSICLLDHGVIDINEKAEIKAEYRLVYLVIDPEKPPFPRVFFPYNSSRANLKLKHVRLLDSKGQGRNVDISLAKDEHLYSNQNVYWDARKVFLDLPALREGDIVDVAYTTEEKPVIPGHCHNLWRTHGDLYALQSDLTVIYPEKIKLIKNPVREKAAFTETKGPDGRITARLLTQNTEVPELQFYQPMPYETWGGYILTTDVGWDPLSQWFQGLYKNRDVLPPDAVKRVAELKTTHTDPAKLAQALTDWVTSDIRYVSVQFGMASHQPQSVADTLKNRYGDCKDMSLLLHALFREAGIPSSLVLVGTGTGRKFDTSTANVQLFDHCILEADLNGKKTYVDATAGTNPIGWFPPQIAKAQALRIGPGTSGTPITLPAYEPLANDNKNKTSITLNPNGSATVTNHILLKGAAAQAMKMSMGRTNTKMLRAAMEEKYKLTGQKLLDFFMTDPSDKGDTYEYRLTLTMPRFAMKSQDGLIFKLGQDNPNGEDWTESLDAPRLYPFRFYPTDFDLSEFEVVLPAGASLKSRPADLKLQNEFLIASRTITQKDQTISVTEQTRLLDATLPASEAPKIKKVFREIQDARESVFVVSLPAAPAPQSPTPAPAK